MAIIIDKSKRVIVQGITGREGRARTRLMLGYGTSIVAGVTPGKAGQEVEGVPVYDRVADAVDAAGGVDISVVFVPARLVSSAAIEAIEAGVKTVLLVPDRVPVWDAMRIAAAARERGATFIGPNTLGVLSPGKAVIGMIGGRAESARQWFNEPIPGRTVGVVSRSGGMTSSCGYYLSRRGIGISTLVHVGGDAIIGLPIPEVALRFQDDPETDAIVVFGEIGGSQEERLAELMRTGRVTKPVIAYIGGKAAREGTRFSHAGAIIEGNRGTHAGKTAALREAGAAVVPGFGDLPDEAVAVLEGRTSATAR
ncbi:MAG: succinate--CoA ligase subunit alpha [Planctomycetota bacterium]|jgi:succinyl-CoA synthetase alpha subunit